MPEQVKKDDGKVAVGCRFAPGVILFREKQVPDGDTGGVRFVRDEDHEPVRLNGSAHPEARFGYGVTMVDRGFWEAWLAQKKNHPMVKGNYVFAEATEERADAKAREHEDLKTGLEGIDPNAPAPKLAPENYQGKPE